MSNQPIRTCRCRACLGRRSNRKGKRKQRAARNLLALTPEQWRPAEAHEETWRAAVRVEVKSGAKAKPVATFYEHVHQQSEATRPIGDFRPFVAVAMPDGWGDGLAVIRIKDLPAVMVALAEEWGGLPAEPLR